eukprot:scaffold5591_cov148-Skeletonema_marinoi.AAC.4
MSKLGANNGNELIVGFSDRKRTSDIGGDDKETATTTMNKQVSFSSPKTYAYNAFNTRPGKRYQNAGIPRRTNTSSLKK